MSSKNNYVVAFTGKNVDLYDTSGKIIRRFQARAEVVNAQVSGSGRNATISITMKDGKFEIYKADGTVVRRT